MFLVMIKDPLNSPVCWFCVFHVAHLFVFYVTGHETEEVRWHFSSNLTSSQLIFTLRSSNMHHSIKKKNRVFAAEKY